MSVNKSITAEQWVKVKSIVGKIIELPNDPELVKSTIDKLCEYEEDIKPTVIELVSLHFNSQDETISPQKPALSMLTEKDDSVIGQSLAKYKILKLLGQGGMGKVYLARREDEIHQNVAIKIIDIDCIEPESLSRFDVERRLLAGLEHPNITRLLDAGKIDNKAFYIMEYVDGVPIDQYCDKHQLNLTDRLKLFLKVCEAVSYAHRNLIVHRDLKPSNILVNKEGEVKLLDFGIAKPLKQLAGMEKIQETIIGTHALTPQYASPEQLNNDAITVMCDVYLLGLLVYKLLTQKDAFDFTDRYWHEIHVIINEEIPQIASKSVKQLDANLNSDGVSWHKKLKGDLDTIIHHTLKKKPSERYQSVDDLVKDIKCYLKNEPISLKNNVFSYRLKMFAQKFWLPISAVSTVFFILLISVLMISHQKNIAVQEMQKATFLSDTFIKAFKSADPSKSNGVNLTAIDIVKQTQKIIQSDEKVGSETVKAELVLSIAEVYRNLGETKLGMEAIKSLEPYFDLMSEKVKSKYYAERLMASFKNSLSTDSIMALIHESSSEVEQTPDLLFVHAYLYRQFVQDRKAEIALNTYYQELEPDNELYFPSCALLGHIKLASTQFEEAKNILEGCLNKIDVNDGNAWEVSEIYFILGRLYIAFEDGKKAVDRLLKAKDIRGRVIDIDHMEIGNLDIFLSDAYLLHGDYEKAKYHADQALQIRTNYFLKNKMSSNGLFKPIFRIANYYKEIGEFAKAKEKYEEVIRMRTESGAKFAFNTGVHFLRYGVLLCEMKLTEQALLAFNDAISVFMQPKYNDIEYKTMVDIKMAECFDSQGNKNKALELMKKAIVHVNIHFKPYQSIYKQAQKLFSKLSNRK